jgi:chitinase
VLRPAVRQVGYYIQWGVYGRGFFVKNLDTSGEAAKLTDLDYAFANVAPEGDAFTCQSSDVWADYEQPITADKSVDGVAGKWGDVLNGNFGQLLKLKAKYPKLKVILSLGGWSESKYFSDAALTPQSRAAFVSSCVDRFIKGNLPSLGPGDAGGPGSAVAGQRGEHRKHRAPRGQDQPAASAGRVPPAARRVRCAEPQALHTERLPAGRPGQDCRRV